MSKRFDIGDDSDAVVAAGRGSKACKRECKRGGKVDNVLKHYRVRTKSKPAVLFCGRKGSKR